MKQVRIQYVVYHALAYLTFPSRPGRMLPAAELVNDDVPWLKGPELTDVRMGLSIVHPLISSKVTHTNGCTVIRLTLFI